MALLSSTVSIMRYKVEGKIKDPVLETVANSLKENAILEIDGDNSEKTVGWTLFDNPFSPDFEHSSFVVGPYLVFSLRIDKKTIPPKIIKKHYKALWEDNNYKSESQAMSHQYILAKKRLDKNIQK